MRENIVSHDAASHGARERLAETVAVVAFERAFGGFHIEIGGLVDEVDLFDGRGRGEIVDHAQVKSPADGVFFGVRRCAFGATVRVVRLRADVLRDGSARCGRRGLGGTATQGGGHFTVDKVRVLAGNNGAGFAPLRVGGDDIDIKFLVDVVGQRDCYVSAGDILFAGLYTLGRHVA